VEMKDEYALYTRLPLGAAEFEATLQRTGRLTVDTSLVGVFQAEKASVRADELQGDCAGATHFVYAVAVGAFDFYSGGQANVGADAGFGNFGAGGHSEAERTTLKKAGDLAACDKATTGDKLPPEGCGALIRVEVYPLGEAKQYSPTCPGGTQWDGSQCVGQKVVTQVQCPGGTTWNGSQCVGSAPTGEGARNGGARLPDVSAVRGSGSTTSPSPVKVRINTDPDGASVREDGVELCSSTPCDILYKGSDAEPTMVHKLTFARNGYRSETRTLRVAESPLSVKLTTGDTAASLQPMSGSGGSSPPPAAAQDTHAAVPAVGPGRFTVVTVGGQGGQWHVKVRIDLPQPPSTGVVDTFFTFVKHPSGARQIQRMSVNYGNASGQVFKSVYFEFDLTHAQGFFDPGDYDVWIAGPNGNIGAAQSVSLR